MKKFMLIFMGPEYEDLDWSAEQMEKRMHNWTTWVEQLASDGVYLDGKGLLKNVKTLKGGPDVIMDGPYADTKETVGGFFIVQATDIDEAVKIAKDFPDFDLGGGVEVRECMPEEG